MKQLLKAVLVLCFLIVHTSAFAGQFGAPEPLARYGCVSLGIGSFYSQNNWEPKDAIDVPTVKAKSWQHYLQMSVAGPRVETYFRIGGANMEVEKAFSAGYTISDPNIQGFKYDLEDDYRLFGTIGVKGVIDINEHFGIGPFIQATMSDDYEDSTSGIAYGIPASGTLKIKRPWEIDLGITLQYKNKGFVAYAGPFLYWGKTDVEWTAAVPTLGLKASGETTYEMENVFGAVVGLRIPVIPGLNVEIEGQFTDEVSGGANISYAF